VDEIMDGFRQLHPRLVQLSEVGRASKEADIRHWCIDVLKSVLGYNDEEIASEANILGQYADIVLKKDGKVFLVIECKNIRTKLTQKVKYQAANYANNVSAEWVVITNGKIWKLYRLRKRPGQDPHFIEVFDVALLDEDGVSESDAENLYLLTSRAVFGGELDKKSHEVACVADKRIKRALESDRVIKALRLELAQSYKAEHDQNINLSDSEVRDRLQELLGDKELHAALASWWPVNMEVLVNVEQAQGTRSPVAESGKTARILGQVSTFVWLSCQRYATS
jgi:predicted type IV restriction endonuclease